MNSMIRNALVLLTLLLNALCTQAAMRLPAIFTDNMVLQQQSSVRIWGWAEPGEVITITTSWSQDTIRAKTTGDADWKAQLSTPSAGGPYQLTIRGNTTIVLKNVMIGEVWICSGQSNMEWSASRGVKDAQQQLPSAYNQNIRLFTVAKATAASPQRDMTGQWQVCDSASLATFSAVGYFFGKKLQENLRVPVGIINISWGGTPAETWIPKQLIDQQPELANNAYSKRFTAFDHWPVESGFTYNAMIAPVTSFAVAGVIWYQGESNAGYPSTYYQLFKTLVESWRSAWNKPLPFYYVQIAPFSNYGGPDNPAKIREQQVLCLQIPGTGMVVTTDLVDDVKNIHPSYKKEVGNRLANWALAETYRQAGLTYKSPVYKKMEIANNQIRVYFDYVGQGLVSNGKVLNEFEIAGEDKVFMKAQAKIEGNTVVVSAKEVRKPVAVRFAFSKGPLPNLFNKANLPVSPFRTDNWE